MARPSLAPPKVPTAAQTGRMKFLWRTLLISNFVLGAYLFIMPKKKRISKEISKALQAVPPPPAETTTLVHEKPILLPPPPEPVKLLERVSEDQQRELCKWMLEERTKEKPQNCKEKQRINAEKAILKQFIQKESIPSI